jgi:DNA-3-methyladenine glycosylase II
VTVPHFDQKLRRAERALSKADPALSTLIARVGPCPLRPNDAFEPFQALTRSICHQQLHGKAAETIHGRLLARFGDGSAPDLERIRRARLATLRSCGLSESKAKAIKDLALKCHDGTVPPAAALWTMSDDDIVEHVTVVRGIGRWTVEMMLIFHLARLDVFPVDDFGVRKGFAVWKNLSAPLKPQALMKEGEPYRPYRSVLSWYLWRVADGL